MYNPGLEGCADREGETRDVGDGHGEVGLVAAEGNEGTGLEAAGGANYVGRLLAHRPCVKS